MKFLLEFQLKQEDISIGEVFKRSLKKEGLTKINPKQGGKIHGNKRGKK